MFRIKEFCKELIPVIEVDKILKRRTVGIVVVVLAVIAIIIVAYISKASITQEKIMVSGLVTTVGVGTSPLRIDFEKNTGDRISATVDSNNRYSINLDAPESYKVIVTYSASGVVSATCDGGTLPLDTSSKNITYDIKC